MTFSSIEAALKFAATRAWFEALRHVRRKPGPVPPVIPIQLVQLPEMRRAA